MAKTFKDLTVYQKAFELSMQIFESSKLFPVEERYSLTDQIRRSSRGVCTNLAEGYRKRQYLAHFLSKLSDSDMENSETQVWLDFAFRCGYLSSELHKRFLEESSEVGRMLNYMIQNPEKFQ